MVTRASWGCRATSPTLDRRMAPGRGRGRGRVGRGGGAAGGAEGVGTERAKREAEGPRREGKSNCVLHKMQYQLQCTNVSTCNTSYSTACSTDYALPSVQCRPPTA